MTSSITVFTLDGIPEVQPGDDLAEHILGTTPDLRDGRTHHTALSPLTGLTAV